MHTKCEQIFRAFDVHSCTVILILFANVGTTLNFVGESVTLLDYRHPYIFYKLFPLSVISLRRNTQLQGHRVLGHFTPDCVECGLGSNIIVRMPVSMIKFIKLCLCTFFSSVYFR